MREPYIRIWPGMNQCVNPERQLLTRGQVAAHSGTSGESILGDGNACASGEVTQAFLTRVIPDGEGDALIGVAASNLAALHDTLAVPHSAQIRFPSALHAVHYST